MAVDNWLGQLYFYYARRMHDVSYRNSHNHINRGALYIMGNGENFKIIPKEIYFYKANQPTSFSWIKVSCEKEEIVVQIDKTSLKVIIILLPEIAHF